MAQATQDRNATHEREHYQFGFPVAAGAVIFKGTIVGAVAAANVLYAKPWVAGDRVIGVAQEQVNNTGGANGAKEVSLKRGCFRFANDGTINATHINTHFAKPLDNQTVALDGTVKSVTTAGVIVDVDAAGVWVEFRAFL